MPQSDVAAHPPAGSTLVLGGARSGKSAYAERLLAEHCGTRIYVATAEAQDAEMAQRIADHQAQRGAGWTTLVAPLDLVETLQTHCRPDSAVLVDCLTLWLSNLMGAARDVAAESVKLAAALPNLEGRTVFVANEVGLGIVPENALARRFRDEAGRLNQAIAQAADRVVFIAAGLPLTLKP